MAELIELSKEQMLPELEQMKRIQLFDDDKIRDIVNKRVSYIHHLQRQTKSLKDYLQYIKFERNLIGLIKERRKNLRIFQKKASIELPIAQRIKALYKLALERFPEKVRVWEEYIQFCKQFKFAGEVSPILDKMIKFHGDKPETWQKAVLWEYEEIDNIERVKHFMLGGLQRHPGNQSLYCCFFKIKLLEAAKLKPDNEDFEAELTNRLAQAEVIYRNGKERIHSIDFLVEILEVSDQFSVAKPIQEKILMDMKNEFPLEELMWHTLAQRELEGKHFAEENSEPKTKKCIELCLTVYETACETLKTQKMWSFYLNALIDLRLDSESLENLREKTLIKVFKEALNLNMISEEHFLKFIEILSEQSFDANKELILNVLQKATDKYPTSLQIWELFMRFHIENNEQTELENVFRKAIKSVTLDNYPLWHLLILYYQTCPDSNDKVNKIFDEGIRLGGELSKKLIPKYLEFLTVSKGISSTRKKYKELSTSIPACLELHKKMIELETMQVRPDVPALRKCHEMAAHSFGNKVIDIWIEFLKFERDFGDPKKICTLQQRAENTLHVELVTDFVNQCNLMRSGVV